MGCQKGIQEEQIARETSLSRASLFKALSADRRAFFQGLDSDLSLHLKLSASAKEIATAAYLLLLMPWATDVCRGASESLNTPLEWTAHQRQSAGTHLHALPATEGPAF
jgi:hypothetical protein